MAASLITVPLLVLLHVKSFSIFHDCGHHSYTPSKLLNYVLGILVGVFVNTPFNWSFIHQVHHMTVGKIDNTYDYPYTDTIFHSVQEYKQFSYPVRQLYKFFRHPFVFFCVYPVFQFLLVFRFHAFLPKKVAVENMNTFIYVEQIFNDISILLLHYIFYKHSILGHYILSHVIASNIGFILIHIQHAFYPPYIVQKGQEKIWNVKDSGIKGSSFLQVPFFLRYFTGGIEYHHIHHMNAKIPNYHLRYYHEEVVSNNNMFDNVVKLSMMDAFRNLWLVLYDEETNNFVTMAEANNQRIKVE